MKLNKKFIVLISLIVFIMTIWMTILIVEANEQLGTEENPWDISATNSDNVKAWISDEGVLTIYGTGKMKSNYPENYPWYNKKENIYKIAVEEGIKNIGIYAFDGFNNVTQVELPTGLENIGRFAFSGCSSIEKIEIPNDVKIMDNNIFDNCTSLEEINFPDKLISISGPMFEGCKNLRTISVNETNNILSVEDRCFI